MVKILITGASGLIGRECAKQLENKGQLYSLVSRDHPNPPRGKIVKGNILDTSESKKLLEEIRPDLLVHLAWDVTGKYWDSDSNQDWLNASIELAENFRRVGGTRFVGAGTCAEYDLFRGERCVEGVTPLVNPGKYPDAKRKLNSHLRDMGIDYGWGRFFYLFGEGEDRNRKVPGIIRLIGSGEQVPTEQGIIREYTYVPDAAKMFSTMALSTEQGEFNMAYGDPISELDLINGLAWAMGKKVDDLIRVVPRSPNSPIYVAADCTKYVQRLGQPPRTSFNEAIARTVDWNSSPHSIK